MCKKTNNNNNQSFKILNDNKSIPNIEDLLKIERGVQTGGSGSVYLAEYLPTKKKVAVKLVPFRSESARTRFLYEAVTSTSLAACEDIISTKNYSITKHSGYLVMEYLKGDLLDSLDFFNTEKKVKKIVRQICQAIQFCHKRRIAHLDIKPENILITENNDAKLCDFGHAYPFDAKMLYPVGTLLYNAPETVNNLDFSKSAVDIWSIGVLLYVLLTGNFPFHGETEPEVLYHAQKGNLNLDFKFCSLQVQDLVKKMLEIDYKMRPNINEVLQHPWFD